MGVLTTYQCDNCDHVQDRPEQMWYVGVNVTAIGSIPKAPAIQKLWCRMCVEKLHLLPPAEHKEKRETLPEKPALEEQIREIVRDEVAELLVS